MEVDIVVADSASRPETIPFEVVLEIGQRAEVCSTGNGGYEMMKRCWPTAE